MDDRDLSQRISLLVQEEHALLAKGEGDGMTDDDRVRLHELEAALDQCWDLLRQRRARREYGLDPDRAQQRDATTVRHYLQ